jgi:hypothetical protein
MGPEKSRAKRASSSFTRSLSFPFITEMNVHSKLYIDGEKSIPEPCISSPSRGERDKHWCVLDSLAITGVFVSMIPSHAINNECLV